MDFSQLSISYQYRSDDEDGHIVRDFYNPVLSIAKKYKRAVGYFTSGSLISVAKGMRHFINNGGQMQLIASPKLNEHDIEAITKGYKARKTVIEEALVRQMENNITSFMEECYNYLAWLIYKNQLDIKIAVVKGDILSGIYHEKIGIVEDESGHKIAFSGSLNETEGGLTNNFESIDVFCSWNPSEEARVEKKELDFNRLWNNQTKELEIIDFPAALRKKILSYKKDTIISLDSQMSFIEANSVVINEYYPLIPPHLTIREYQQNAIKSWFRNDCQGLLEMATGTGKTITALAAIAKLAEVTKRLAVIIVCPYMHLVDQWVKDINLFNMSPVIAYRSRSVWQEDLANYVAAYNSGVLNHFCLITTNATFATQAMQEMSRNIKGEVAFIADEAHHLGAEKGRMYLNENFPYRLALSATPNRWFDDEGTSKLLNYFGGKVVFEFGLNHAIGQFLTEYYYYPHIITLDEDEAENYFEITRKIVKMYPKDDNTIGDNKSLEGLLIERARIINHARNKIGKLKEIMQEQKDESHNIVYCGDSNVDGEKQIDAVVKLLGTGLNMKVHTFTSREDANVRKKLLEKFESGELQTLVAIKCLDEGVDVPATKRAFILASSTNPREFIQRRGRVLRKHPNKKYSYIHDFIVVPRKLDEIKFIDTSVFNTERNMIKRELKRFCEFADLALNGPLAHQILNEIKHAYNLLEM
ncbi:DEAD/DEAH box helicase family protein [Peribacillus sp. B-H-3]|uniref:DEAD/DEAH box helicase family protein n=1 Tax=Peribacillus sp. B-H-3 TaxID=3400420 RepID=UPI003B014562